MSGSRKPRKQKIHFIGVGGIGISALARWFLAQKWTVSGSDLTPSSTTRELQKEGLKLKIGHRKENLPRRVSMVVYSNAVSQDSPELKEAQRRGVHPMSYPQTLGCLSEVYKTVAIAGSHGKSTTTALVGLILKDSPLDPTIVIGTKLKELDGKNFRLGKTIPGQAGPLRRGLSEASWLVLEADEYRGAFLHYHPDVAVVTNIDKEHLDHYKNLKAIQTTFLRFLARTKPGGVLVLNRDDRNLASLAPLISKLAKKRSLRLFWYSLRNKKEVSKIKKHIRIPGKHNISNALAALTVARELHLNEVKALKNIGRYQGAWRRMEYKGELKTTNSKLKIKVFDDYAHHPSEIKATLQAFQERFPQSKIICVFQPHQARRLKALYSEFQKAFGRAWGLILLPTYEVAGRDSREKMYTSEKLAAKIAHLYPRKKVLYLPDPKRVTPVVKTLLDSPNESEAVVVMMGAGNILDYTPLLLK